jgi:hypothetical protein
MEMMIKFGGYGIKPVNVEFWPHHGIIQIESWGKTQHNTRSRIPLRVMRDGIKQFCNENGIAWGSSHAQAQAQYLRLIKRRNKSGMWK